VDYRTNPKSSVGNGAEVAKRDRPVNSREEKTYEKRRIWPVPEKRAALQRQWGERAKRGIRKGFNLLKTTIGGTREVGIQFALGINEPIR